VIDESFRRESARLIAYLTKIFGPQHLTLAEDVAQEAFLRAVRTWAVHGPPPNPAAWLRRVARNLAVDQIRRNRLQTELPEDLPAPTTPMHDGFDDDEIRMLFLCCHPALAEDSRIALVLNVVAGLSVREIARGMLTTEEAISQRIVRAKRTIRDSQLSLDLPTDASPRLHDVLRVLYLLFNEGYLATTGDTLTRDDLCDQAIEIAGRLNRTKIGRAPATLALLALMLLHSSRLPARISAEGQLCLLEDQDRSRWDQKRIAHGLRYLADSAEGDTLTPYHCEAAIAACHAQADHFDDTDWASVVHHYNDLVTINPSPIGWLNRAVAIAAWQGPSVGLENLELLAEHPKMQNYLLFFATRARLYQQLGDLDLANDNYRRALALARNSTEVAFLNDRIQNFSAQAF
jgi:RNA polymerase sigma-70 factor (ECF subfamily)